MVAVQHLLDLLHASWSSLLASLGTTTLAVIVAVGTFLLSLVLMAVRGGITSLRAHISQTLRDGLILTAIVWSLLYGWNVAKTVYSDHEQLVEQLEKVKIAAATSATPKPPKLVGLGYTCEISATPTETPPHTTNWVLPLAVNNGNDGGAVEGVFSGFMRSENGGNKPFPFINREWLKELKTPVERFALVNPFSGRRCEIRNSGQQAFLNVEIIFEFDFATGGSKEEMKKICSRPYAVIIPEIDPGTPFVFYVVNQTRALANFRFPMVAALELPDSTRQVVGIRQVGSREDMLFFLEPTQIRWNGRAPEDKDACENFRQSRQKH